MSFDDLPDDWPHRSVADPILAADLVDLVVSDADRREGALGLLLCRPDGTLAQPVIVTTQDCPDVPHLLDLVVDQLPRVPALFFPDDQGGMQLAAPAGDRSLLTAPGFHRPTASAPKSSPG